MKKLVLLLLTTTLIAAPVSKKSFYGYSDFKKGELRGTSLNIDGTIELTKKIEKVTELSETFVWSSVSIDNFIYLSAGEKGKIYKFNTVSKESPKLLTFFDEGTVYALGVFNGKLYAALSPSGQLFQVDLTTGKQEEIIKTNCKYIWQIISNDKYMYLACGMPGKIIRLDKNNIRKDFAENLDSHIESLALKDNALYFGTSPSGYILKSESIEKSYLIYDSPFKEIKGLSWYNNKLYAICFNGKPEDNPDEKIKPAQQIKESKNLLGGIVSINNDNLPTILYKFTNFAPTSMESTNNGILIGTGHSGKLIFLDNEDNLLIKGEVDNGQITDFCKINKTIYFSTSNSANLYSLDNSLNLKGEYISEPFDATVPVNWGNFEFTDEIPKGSRVEYEVRGGNSASPDITWSNWQIVQNGSKPKLPVSSKIQWKAKLISYENSITPKFIKTEFYYREVNYKPTISSIYILPPGFIFSEKADIPKDDFIPAYTKKLLTGFKLDIGIKFGYKKGSISFLVKATDENNDNLEYSFSLLNSNGNKLELEDFSEKSYYSLNSESVPEGTYKLEVKVRDKKENFPDFFTVDKISTEFIIDNTNPSISNITTTGNIMKFSVTDSLSVIEKVLISSDKGKTFVEIYPEDKISDSKKEDYSFTIPAKSESIFIQAFDCKGNSSSKFTKN